VQIYGPDCCATRSAVHEGNTHRVVFQGVHMLMAGDMGRPWARGRSVQHDGFSSEKICRQELFIKGLEQCLVEKQ